MTSCERCRRSPGSPARSTANRARDRQRSGPPGSASTVTGTSRCASRDSCSRTTSALSASWPSWLTCCQSQPPHFPGPLYGQGRSIRSGAACSTSTASARQNRACRSSVTSTTTRSPGSACRTNTTRPSCRATQCPPCATGPTVTWNRRPSQPRPRSAIRGLLHLVGQPAAQVAGSRPVAVELVVPVQRALQLPGHAGDHHAGLELQPGAQPQCALVGQQVLPPVPDHVLPHEDHDQLAGAGPADVPDEVQHRP